MKEKKEKIKKERKKFNKKKFFITLAIFWAIGTLITVTALYFVERYIISLSGADVNENKSSNKDGSKTIEVSKNATNIQYSYDNKYYTYLFESKVYIGSIDNNGSIVDTIEEENPICYYDLLYDKNLILYFTKVDNGTSATLKLNTYDIGTKRKTEYNTFTVKNFSAIKNMDMSPVINMIYINVEQKNGNTTNNIIYKINLFNTMSQIKSGLIVNDMIMLQQTDTVYYEDSNSNIYHSSAKLGIFKEKVNMIGIDTNDTLYFMSQDNSKVYKVKDNKITDTIELKDKDVVKTYHNNMRVFAVYSNYVIELSADDPTKNVGKVPDNVTFEAIKSNKMYVRVDEDTLKQVELDLENIEYDSASTVDNGESTTSTTTDTKKQTTTETKTDEKVEESKTAKVPKIIGEVYSNGSSITSDGISFTIVIDDRVDSQKSAGTVITQTPSAGSVTTDRTIHVTVSSGS